MDTAHALLFRTILADAMKKGATDIHMNIGSHPMIRVDGQLQPLDEHAIFTEEVLEDLTKTITTTAQKEELQKKHEILFSYVFDERIRAKVHLLTQEGKRSLTFHLLSLSVKTPRELGVPGSFDYFTTLTRGLLIITGRRGAGKTTLAAALLEQINRTRASHIVMLESPKEYDLIGNKSIIDQREVGSDSGSFEEALKALSQDDVDVLFVSDCSSLAVLRTLLQYANSGIYVIAIMNSDSVVRVLETVISSFPQGEQELIAGLLADALEGVIVQELIPKIGGGQVAVHELLLSTTTVATLIRSHRLTQLEQTITSSHREGMMSFDHELAFLVRNHVISLESARERAHDQETLESLLKG